MLDRLHLFEFFDIRTTAVKNYSGDYGKVSDFEKAANDESHSDLDRSDRHLVQIVILSRIDCCNVAIVGMPQRSIICLQAVIIATAQLDMRLKKVRLYYNRDTRSARCLLFSLIRDNAVA